jgi:hypothetical protein
MVRKLNADEVDGLSSEQLRVAYARVDPFNDPDFDTSRTSGFASVTRTSTGEYCLEPASGVQVRGRAIAVSVDFWSTSHPESAANAMFSDADCGTNGIEIKTQRLFISSGVLSDVPADDIGFTVVVP